AGQQVFIERATVQDADVIRLMVIAAYAKYVERIGREPAPMTADQHAIIADPTQDIYVLRRCEDGKVVGSILLSDSERDDSTLVDNLVVDPELQGRGYGRLLMDFAHDYARAKGRPALTLFTNEKMYENHALYVKMGFIQVDKRVENGYHRVYFRKQL
ncbi:acyl-CoA N-acyltransferase, partial [Cryphonectria parasitica EP155]